MLKTLAKLSRFLPFFGLNNAVFPDLRCRHCFPDMATPYIIYITHHSNVRRNQSIF